MSYHIWYDIYIYIRIIVLVISIRHTHTHTFATRQCTLEPGSRQCRVPIHSPESQKRFPPACVRGFGRRSSQLPRVRDLASPLILKATCDCHLSGKRLVQIQRPRSMRDQQKCGHEQCSPASPNQSPKAYQSRCCHMHWLLMLLMIDVSL